MNILFDIGGTNMRIARSSGDGFDEPLVVETPPSFAEAMSEFERIMQALSAGEKIDAIVGGVAGMLDRNKATLLYSPHLLDWIGKPLREILLKYSDNVFIENDAAMVGLGEATAGAGVGDAIMAYITISTGVGGARIVNQMIDSGAVGFEPGHHIIAKDDKVSTCPQCDEVGHWEYYVGGYDMEQKVGIEPHDIYDADLWRKFTDDVVVGLHNVSVFWSPDSIVIGGSMSVKNQFLVVEEVQEKLRMSLDPFPYVPKIKKATLKNLGGLHGAAAYARQKGF